MGRAGPYPRTGTARGPAALAARFRGIGTREKWGYAVWLAVGLVFGIPESWAGIGNPPWPALSDTVGHLEALWSPVAVIVVALIVFVAFYAVRYPPGYTGEYRPRPGEPRRARSGNGRLTRSPGEVSLIPAAVYFPLALGVVATGSVIAAAASDDPFVLGYVIYGLFAIFLVIVPNVLAFWFAAEVPFPTLLRTVLDLERRWRPAAVVIAAGLVILMLHLAFFPWPDHG